MNEKEIRKVVIATMETWLELQLQALRQLSNEPPERPPIQRRGGRRRQSMVDQTVEILTERGTAMHVDELVEALLSRCGRVTDRDALASALGKKARHGLLLRKVGPATFEALPEEEP